MNKKYSGKVGKWQRQITLAGCLASQLLVRLNLGPAQNLAHKCCTKEITRLAAVRRTKSATNLERGDAKAHLPRRFVFTADKMAVEYTGLGVISP